MSTCGVGGRGGGEALWRRSETSTKSWSAQAPYTRLSQASSGRNISRQYQGLGM